MSKVEFIRLPPPFPGMEGWSGRSSTKQYVIGHDKKFPDWGYIVSYKPLVEGEPLGPPIHIKVKFDTLIAAQTYVNTTMEADGGNA